MVSTDLYVSLRLLFELIALHLPALRPGHVPEARLTPAGGIGI